MSASWERSRPRGTRPTNRRDYIPRARGGGTKKPRAVRPPGARASQRKNYFTSIVTFEMVTGEVGGPSPGFATASMALSVSIPSTTWPNTE